MQIVTQVRHFVYKHSNWINILSNTVRVNIVQYIRLFISSYIQTVVLWVLQPLRVLSFPSLSRGEVHHKFSEFLGNSFSLAAQHWSTLWDRGQNVLPHSTVTPKFQIFSSLFCLMAVFFFFSDVCPQRAALHSKRQPLFILIWVIVQISQHTALYVHSNTSPWAWCMTRSLSKICVRFHSSDVLMISWVGVYDESTGFSLYSLCCKGSTHQQREQF